MMIALQTIRATTRAPAESAMSAWTSYKTMTMALPIESQSVASAYLSSKRKRDSFEAYDFHVHRQQRMRYSSLLREQPRSQEYLPPSTVYSRHTSSSLEKCVIAPKSSSSPSSPPTDAMIADPTLRCLQSDNIRKSRRRKKSKKPSSRRAVRMTKRHYNKKKRLEMMQATKHQIQCILGTPQQQHTSSQQLHHVLQKAEQLDYSLRGQCNSIVQKEQDIKSWLGMTTSSRSKIVSLRKRLHDRWAEVKDLQSAVKPKRQRLKNLKFAALVVERTISEE